MSLLREGRYHPYSVFWPGKQALVACGRSENVGVCCINMDGGSPDANVRAMFQAARDFAGSRT
jgi:hypothetical protein